MLRTYPEFEEKIKHSEWIEKFFSFVSGKQCGVVERTPGIELDNLGLSPATDIYLCELG